MSQWMMWAYVLLMILASFIIAEERLFCTTNYFTELTNFYPTTNFTFHFAGLELSTERNGKTHIVNERLKGTFYRGSVADFLLDFGIDNLSKARPWVA
jgi:hypothetical protein